MDEEEYHLQSKFYYPEDLETSEAGICESRRSHWGFYKQTEKWKHKRRKSTDMNTLLRFIELMAWIVKQLKAYRRPSLITFCQFLFFFFFMNVRRKNGEYEPATFSSFQRNIYSNTSLRRNIHSTYSRTMSLKIEKSSNCEAQVTFSRARQKKRAASSSGDWRKRRRWQENSATPIQLHSKKLCGGFYPYTWVSKPEMRARRTIDLMLLLLKLKMIFTATFSWYVLCDALVNFLGSKKPFCEFQKQTTAVKIFVKFCYKSFFKSFL